MNLLDRLFNRRGDQQLNDDPPRCRKNLHRLPPVADRRIVPMASSQPSPRVRPHFTLGPYLPAGLGPMRGLLTRAWLRALTGALTGPDSAQDDLDEAWEIAARGSMKLHLADIHLYRARLFGLRNADRGLRIVEAYPWISPEHDLAEVERLIQECGYHRRDEELADAKRALLGTN